MACSLRMDTVIGGLKVLATHNHQSWLYSYILEDHGNADRVTVFSLSNTTADEVNILSETAVGGPGIVC